MFILERVISVIAPHNCLGCGVEGKLLCSWCQPDAILPVPQRCYSCSRASQNSLVCQKCRRQSCLKHVWVVTEYEGLPKELVRRLKFERAQSAAKIIADCMAEPLPYLSEGILVTHVPTATKRARLRGYDQSQLIAKQLAKRLKLNYLPLLSRLGQTRQVGAKREQRLKQLEQSFRPLKPSQIKGSHLLLVDDVLTTGATIESAAKTLKKAGAKTVDAIIFAQAK